jgi:hypothetical protein
MTMIFSCYTTAEGGEGERPCHRLTLQTLLSQITDVRMVLLLNFLNTFKPHLDDAQTASSNRPWTTLSHILPNPLFTLISPFHFSLVTSATVTALLK